MTVLRPNVPTTVVPRRRPLGAAACAVGTVCVLVSYLAMPWFTVTGPNVVSSESETAPSSRDVLLVDPSAGTHHSVFTWLIVAGCLLAAAAAQLPRVRARLAWRVAAIALAAVALLGAVFRAVVPGVFIDEVGDDTLRGVTVHLDAGLWIACAGLVLVAAGAIAGPARSERGQPIGERLPPV